MPVDPINAIDCSVLLHKYSRWDDVVDCCFEFVRKILIEEEHRDKTQWCSFTFFEQQEWENEDGTAVLSTFFRKFINLIHGKISRELYPHHIHKDASYPCIFYNPIES